MRKDVKLLIVSVFFSIFLISCGNADQKKKSVKDIPEKSFNEESKSVEFNCDNFQENYASYDEAVEAIAETDFRIEETINTSKNLLGKRGIIL